MCMHNSQLLDVTELSVCVIREIRKGEIRSPYFDLCKWEVGEKKSLDITAEDIQREIGIFRGDLAGGVFHSFKYLSDAIAQLREDFDEFSYVIYEATASGVIGKGKNGNKFPCFFSTELTLNKIVYDKRKQ